MRPEVINRYTFRDRCRELLSPWGVLGFDQPYHSPGEELALDQLTNSTWCLTVGAQLDNGAFRKALIELALLGLCQDFGLRVMSFNIVHSPLSMRFRLGEGQPGYIDEIADTLVQAINDAILPIHLMEALEKIPAINKTWWIARVQELQRLTWRVLTLKQSAFLVKKTFPALCSLYETPLNPPGPIELILAKKADPETYSDLPHSYGGQPGKPAILTVTQGSSMYVAPEKLEMHAAGVYGLDWDKAWTEAK